MRNKRGQSTLEYALIIAVVIAGLLIMQYYIKRGYSGRLKSAADDMGEQFDPTAYSANFTVTSKSLVNQTIDGATNTTYLDLGGDYAGSGRIQSKKTTSGGSESVSSWGTNESLYNR